MTPPDTFKEISGQLSIHVCGGETVFFEQDEVYVSSLKGIFRCKFNRVDMILKLRNIT